MMQNGKKQHQELDRERGSVTIFMAAAAFVMIVLVGLAVDLGGQVAAQQRARDVAGQAARAGGEQVLGGPAVEGQGAQIDTNAAAAAARSYLASAGVDGTVAVTSNDTLVVTTSQNYQTKFLSVMGIGSLHVTGHSSARLIRAQNGVAR
ncbi:TadE/TadG family type IV pilus assembly protein [Flexivirga oryzae]|uniref:Flp pilus assembly protein TadG n=1 Tax=Flexivirga oryzae TaxID=1794944 RepID=A0A839N7N9_9MICO|nr:Tad domain-containing protein [Flexivirga oryzae]MBB2892163.1 Flp pilus assembly protein TadG [Flexivirga oryzae]